MMYSAMEHEKWTALEWGDNPEMFLTEQAWLTDGVKLENPKVPRAG